ncbi:MAG: aminodeoxychorismate synthase component I [Chloroflexi bacterium]|mgnify:CR=1 FL=1|nr:aminodeoxychorismate synthase component I [Chloroflexota bacterium]OJV92815.1 MAG: aminodeoxychorismate synthase, component I [Chloroflexi bacterium 54-19]
MKELPGQFYDLLAIKNNSVLLETSLGDATNRFSYLFTDPVEILELHTPGNLNDYLLKIENLLEQGYFVAGFFGYECGYFIEKLGVDPTLNFEQPLAWFGVYRKPLIFDHFSGVTTFPESLREEDFLSTPTRKSDFLLKDLNYDLTEADYAGKIARIKEYIRAGDTYQINFTGRYKFKFAGSPLVLYRALKKNQEVSFGAYIQNGTRTFLSFSPELFFRIEGNMIITKPMKGTIARGQTEAEDLEKGLWLHHDEKNRAENVMIVDLLRNDIGQLCEPGSVNVPELFNIEKYKTLFQMTSTVEGTLRKEVSLTEIFKSLFPSGSITGAPKIRSMQIIRELETQPRGIYTGSIGYFAPTLKSRSQTGISGQFRNAEFNVAIRTLALTASEGEMGVGSGIVYDSSAKAEFEECRVKAKFLTNLETDFSLLEAILWDKEFVRLPKHLTRLLQSANYFGFTCDPAYIEALLKESLETFPKDRKYKVRIQLEKDGRAVVSVTEVAALVVNQPLFIKVSDERIDSTNPFIYHKTTRRELYDRSFNEATLQNFADVIFLNERQEITEGAISNVLIQKDGQLLTPPLTCGLLNGIYRDYLLEEKFAQEKVLFLDDLKTADKIFICNSVRGMREVFLG